MIVWGKRVLKIMFRVWIVQSKKMRNSLEVDASSWQWHFNGQVNGM